MVATIVQRLKGEGFLQPAQGGKLNRIDSPAVAARRKQIYCNPMTLIGHCVSRHPSNSNGSYWCILMVFNSTNLAADMTHESTPELASCSRR